MKTKSWTLLRLIAGFIAVGMAALPTAAATLEYFLKLDGVEGDSLDARHAGEIGILSFSFGMSQPPAGGAGGIRVQFRDLALTAVLSKASPVLALKCASGRGIRSAILTARKADGAEFYTITLSNVIVTSLAIAGDADGGPPRDNLTLLFETIQWSYRPQKPDGSLGNAVTTGWDLRSNTAL